MKIYRIQHNSATEKDLYFSTKKKLDDYLMCLYIDYLGTDDLEADYTHGFDEFVEQCEFEILKVEVK